MVGGEWMEWRNGWGGEREEWLEEWLEEGLEWRKVEEWLKRRNGGSGGMVGVGEGGGRFGVEE